MKRIISILITVFILVSCFAFSVSAANDGIVKAGRVTAKAGDTITIPVTYEEQPGVYVIRVILSYDSNVVELVEVEQTASEYFNYTTNTKTDGAVTVLMDAKAIGNVTENITLFNVKFKVKKDAHAGRALFPVECSSGDATGLKKVDGKYQTVSLIPSTSTGSVTVLCEKHTFDLEMDGGKLQCSVCGAVKTESGEVSVDSNAGLPEVDISSSTDSVTPPESSQNSELKSNDEGDNSDNGFKIWYLFPIFAALIIIGGCVFLAVKKRKRTEE